MSAALAVFRLEYRFLQRDLLLSVLLFGLAAGAGMLGYLGGHPGSRDPYSAGAVLLILALLGVTRTAAADQAWFTLRQSLPIARGGLQAGRLAFRGLLALPIAAAFVLWVGAEPWRALPQLLTVALWLLVADTAVRYLWQAGRAGWGRAASVVAVSGVAVLALALPGAARGTDEWLELEASVALLGAALAALLMLSARSLPEWLPTMSPKPVRPRSNRIGGLVRRKTAALTPGEVLSRLRGDSSGTSWAFAMGIALALMTLSRGVRPLDTQEAFLLLPAAVVIAWGMSQQRAQADLLRSYPLPPQRILARPFRFAMILVVVAAFVLLTSPILPGRVHLTGGNMTWWDRDTQPLQSRERACLAVPSWAASAEATHDRPAGMPAPSSSSHHYASPQSSFWPLRGHVQGEAMRTAGGLVRYFRAGRQNTLQIQDAPAYFQDSLRYYLHLVHGVSATDRELEAALGQPLVVDRSPALIPRQYFQEYQSSGGSLLASFGHGVQAPGLVRVESLLLRVRSVGREKKGDLFAIVPPLELYAFAPALESLEASLQPRLLRATFWTWGLDLALATLALLLCVRLVLIEGPTRWALPLLPALLLALWVKRRADPAHLALRDVHLAYPWVSVVLTLVLAGLLIVSIGRQLRRMEPMAIPR